MDLEPIAIHDSCEAGPAGQDAAWFRRLWSESHARVFNLAARIVGDRDDAADITQEVFLKAFTHPPDEKGLRDPYPWLYRVTVNTCYDHLRRRAVRPTTALEDARDVASTRDAFAAAEMTHAVEAALGALTPRYRAALVLRDLHGLGTDEVAGVMGVNRATARVLLHRARASFRRAFREAAPAGGTVTVAGLAAFLPTLTVPAALQAPPSVAGLTPAAPLALSALPLSTAPAAATPVAAVPAAAAPVAGVLAKIGSAAGAKIAVVAAGAAMAAGGAVAVREAAVTPSTPARSAPAAAQMRTPVPGATAGARADAGAGRRAGLGAGQGQGDRQGTLAGQTGPAAGAKGSGQGSGGRAGAADGSPGAGGSRRGDAGSGAGGPNAGSGSGAGSEADTGSAGAGDGAGGGAGAGGSSGGWSGGLSGGGPGDGPATGGTPGAGSGGSPSSL